jgi:hypothetical protein
MRNSDAKRLNQAAPLCGVGLDELLELFADKNISCPHEIFRSRIARHSRPGHSLRS